VLSIGFRGFNYGIDFKGGRTYTVRFDEEVRVADVQQSLATTFGIAPEVKTFGGNNQVKITTTYKVDDMSENVDNEVEGLLYKGLVDGGHLENASYEDFTSKYRMSSQKVGPTISYDIKKDAIIAIIFALIIIFLYILVRFSNWQYGLGQWQRLHTIQ
jgi:SecD/SecF fusion protein